MADEIEEEEDRPPKLCFVVSPIGAAASPERRHADWLLKGIVEPVFENAFDDFRVERADQINAPGMIDSQVITRLLDAELVIADMSFLNANAFYEMGIRHMKQKPIIHMYRVGETIPFDVAPHRAIPFAYDHPEDLVVAQGLLRAALDEVLKPGFQVENPVTRARGVQQIEQHATPEQKLLIDQMQQMQNRIDTLEGLVRMANENAMRAMGSPPMDLGSMPAAVRDYRNAVAHGRPVEAKLLVWQFTVEIEPGHETRINEIIDEILKLKGRSQVAVTDQNTLKVIISAVSGAITRQFMDRVGRLAGVKAVHSAELI